MRCWKTARSICVTPLKPNSRTRRTVFGIPGVSGYSSVSRFVTVTKSAGEWPQLQPMILGADHGALHVRRAAHHRRRAEIKDGEQFFDEADATTIATIKELIETRVRPAVANDSSDITFRGFKDGVVYLNMKGACSGCPSSTATLRHGIRTCCVISFPTSPKSGRCDRRGCAPAIHSFLVTLHACACH